MLRSYDPQLGRFLQHDPYDQFASGYVGMGNDPGNGTDPTGGVYNPSSLASYALNSGMKAASSGVSVFSTIASVAKTTIKVAGLAIGIAVQTSGFALSTEPSKATQNNDDWKPFFKKDLKDYVKSKGLDATENILGDEFEKIFERWIRESLPAQSKLFRFRSNGKKKWTDGNDRNTEPDFVADDYYDRAPFLWPFPEETFVSEGSIYEVKQNSGRGIYLSSNDYQIKGHIDNLSARHASHILTGNYNPHFTLITTYDVAWSKSMSYYALKKKVEFTHRRAQFRIVNGKYEFRFVGFGTSSL